MDALTLKKFRAACEAILNRQPTIRSGQPVCPDAFRILNQSLQNEWEGVQRAMCSTFTGNFLGGSSLSTVQGPYHRGWDGSSTTDATFGVDFHTWNPINGPWDLQQQQRPPPPGQRDEEEDMPQYVYKDGRLVKVTTVEDYVGEQVEKAVRAERTKEWKALTRAAGERADKEMQEEEGKMEVKLTLKQAQYLEKVTADDPELKEILAKMEEAIDFKIVVSFRDDDEKSKSK